MGVVYLAEDETLGREIALKILDRDVVDAADFEQRFRQEARTVAKLAHPNIVPIHSLESTDDVLAIDMAYFERGPLSHVGASPEQAVRWATDILSALRRCHDSGIIHRDVKPSNILLATDGRAMLSDFGLAKLLAVQHSLRVRSTTSSCMFVGTPRYAPPEAWDGAEPGPAWDIYSLGMVLYEKLSPDFPYDATTPLALLKQMMSRPIPALHETNADVSPELSDVVVAMLSQEPDQRPPDGEAALEMLRATPEFRRVGNLGGSTLIRHHRPWSAMKRRIGAYRRLRTPSLRSWSVGLASLFIVSLLLWQVLPRATRQDVGTATSAPMDLSSAQVFDTVDPSGPFVWPGHWLMEPADGPDAWRILASAESHLWELTAKRVERDQFSIAGNWAEYSDSTARHFRYGECRGRGRIVPGRDEIAVALEFTNQPDAQQWNRSFLIRPSATPVDTNAFLTRLQIGDSVPALLYNEIQPRNLAWLDEIERAWLSRVTPIVTVPFTDSPAGNIVVDGQLTESVWQSALDKDTDRMGQVTPHERVDATLHLGYSNDALYLGIRARHMPQECHLEIGILRSFDIHTADSPRWMARAGRGGIVSAMSVNNQTQVPWTCDWQSAISWTDNVWQAEVRIPFSGLAPATVPHAEQRWRLACDLHTDESDSASTPIATWGGSDHTDVERGILVVFGSQELGR
jgi:serine/threonine protein kinase